MINFIINNLGTIIVCIILIILSTLSIIKIVKSAKKGKCVGCSEKDCSNCKRNTIIKKL
jgi:hypothetical protein